MPSGSASSVDYSSKDDSADSPVENSSEISSDNTSECAYVVLKQLGYSSPVSKIENPAGESLVVYHSSALEDLEELPMGSASSEGDSSEQGFANSPVKDSSDSSSLLAVLSKVHDASSSVAEKQLGEISPVSKIENPAVESLGVNYSSAM